MSNLVHKSQRTTKRRARKCKVPTILTGRAPEVFPDGAASGKRIVTWRENRAREHGQGRYKGRERWLCAEGTPGTETGHAYGYALLAGGSIWLEHCHCHPDDPRYALPTRILRRVLEFRDALGGMLGNSSRDYL